MTGPVLSFRDEQIAACKRKHRALHRRWSRVYFDHDRSDSWRRALDQIEDEMRANIEQLKGLRRGH